MVTYVIENSCTRIVFEYCYTLQDAKEVLKKLVNKMPIEHNQGVLCILKLQGHCFGEGFHKYRCYYDFSRDKFIYDRY